MDAATTHLSRRNAETKNTLKAHAPMSAAIMILNFCMVLSGDIICYLVKKYNLSESTDGNFRISAYVFFPSICIIVAIVFIIWYVNGLVRKDKDNTVKLNKLSALIVILCLLVAGELYLTGDNIVLLHKSFNATVYIQGEPVEVKDLRSYLVAISLCFMIISKLVPLVVSQISNYIDPHTKIVVEIKVKQERTESDLWRDLEHCTVLIPAGHCVEWKQAEEHNCKVIGQDRPICHNSGLEFANGESENHPAQIILTSNDEITKIIIDFWGKTTDLSQMKTITVKKCYHENDTLKPHAMLMGIVPTLIFCIEGDTCTWSAEFRIVKQLDSEALQAERHKATVAEESSKMRQKTASLSLIQACFSLLDYALIADALYTTILDEITQQDKSITSGDICPKGHEIVALIIFGIINVVWIVTILIIFPITFCCCTKKYRRLGTWNDIKANVDITMICNYYWSRKKLKETLSDAWSSCDCCNWSKCNAILCQFDKLSSNIVLYIFLLTFCAVLIPVISVSVVNIILLYISIALTLVVLFVILILWKSCKCLKQSQEIQQCFTKTSSRLKKMLVKLKKTVTDCFTKRKMISPATLIYIFTVMLVPNLFMLILLYICEIFIVFAIHFIALVVLGLFIILIGIGYVAAMECCNCWVQCKAVISSVNFWITFLLVVAVSIYLPVYLTADNKWPWICHTKSVSPFRTPLSILALAISFCPPIYSGLKWLTREARANKQIQNQNTVRAVQQCTEVELPNPIDYQTI
jgi:hypothetical protein